jgi:membrane associated rhomboid family serine protease
MTILDEIKNSFKTGSVLTRLIYFNLGVYLAIQIAIIFLHLFNADQYEYFILANLGVPWDTSVLITKPWTAFTYMFVHKDFFHILFNMLWLYWFGKIFLSYLSERQLLAVYIMGGLAGSFLYVASYNIFPGLYNQMTAQIAIGASASIMAIVISIAVLVPDYKIYLVFIGAVKIIYVALAGFVLSSLIDFSINTGGKMAHIGGALFGYLFILRYKKGNDLTIHFSRFINFFVKRLKPEKKMKVSHKKPVDDFEYNKVKAEERKELDHILDKISQKGYDSLTKEEKEKLFKMK